MSATFLNAKQAAAHLQKPTVNALYAFLHRRRKSGFNVRTRRIGRLLYFRREDLDAAITVEEPRHATEAHA